MELAITFHIVTNNRQHYKSGGGRGARVTNPITIENCIYISHYNGKWATFQKGIDGASDNISSYN